LYWRTVPKSFIWTSNKIILPKTLQWGRNYVISETAVQMDKFHMCVTVFHILVKFGLHI